MVSSALPADASALLRGLSEQEVVQRRNQGLGNDLELKSSQSFAQILFANLFTFFNIVLIVLGLAMLALGSPNDAIITTGFMVINVIVAVTQEVRAKQKLDEIALLTRPSATVIRAGQEKEIDPGEIVVGDILVVNAGDQIVVDGELVGNGRIDVDESNLTGEADHIPKFEGDALYSGSTSA